MMKMLMRMVALRLIIGTLLAAALVHADPVLTYDGVAVLNGDPGLGRVIVAEPGSTWQTWFNDNWGRGDYDFNDLVLQIYFGPSSAEVEVIGARARDFSVASIGSVTLDRFDIGPKSFAYVPGTELILSAMNLSSGSGPYYSGAAGGNPDNTIHWWTAQIGGPSPDLWSEEIGDGPLQDLGTDQIGNGPQQDLGTDQIEIGRAHV
jgi:hypothetical protein